MDAKGRRTIDVDIDVDIDIDVDLNDIEEATRAYSYMKRYKPAQTQ